MRRLLYLLLFVVGVVFCESENGTSVKEQKFEFTSHIVALLPILKPISDTIQNEACRNDSRIFLEQLSNFKLWAVKMLDSSTKLPDGILEGSTFQLGHFDECLSVGVDIPDSKTLKGQYCLADIEFSPQSFELSGQDDDGVEFSLFDRSTWHHIKKYNLDRRKTRRDSLRWAICIPNSCTPQDLEESLDMRLDEARRRFNLNINVKVGDKYCQVKNENWFGWIGWPQLALGLVIGTFVLFVNISTLIDLMYPDKDKSEEGSIQKFLACFSARRNFASLVKVDKSKDIIVIHVARFCSMIVILMGHRFIANSAAPTYNASFMEVAVSNPLFIHLLISPVLVVDTFFFLSGFLTGNQMLRDFDSRRFKFFSSVLHRYIRLTPVYMLVVGFYATILYHIGSGPLWNARVDVEAQRCAKNWWTNLLYINNYVNTEEMCMFQSWHVTCDFHFYLMAPPIVYVLLKKPKLGLAIIVGLILVVAGFIFGLTFINGLDPVLMSFNSIMVDLSADPTFRITYIPTHTRFIPYLIGILASYAYYKKQILNQLATSWTWAIVVVLLHIPILSAMLFYNESFDHNVWLASIYGSLHRIPWCLGIGALVLGVVTNNGWIFQPFLSSKGFVPLSRLTYCVFLCHGAVQLYTVGTIRSPYYVSQMGIVWTLMGDILLTYLVALGMHLLFEAPVLRLDRAYFSSSTKKTLVESSTSSEDGGKDNHGFSRDSFCNNDIIFSITDSHQKYSDRFKKFQETESMR